MIQEALERPRHDESVFLPKKRVHSEETKRKMSGARRAYWARKRQEEGKQAA